MALSKTGVYSIKLYSNSGQFFYRENGASADRRFDFFAPAFLDFRQSHREERAECWLSQRYTQQHHAAPRGESEPVLAT